MFQKIKALVYLLVFSIATKAQHNSLVIFSEHGSPFYLSVNNMLINKIAESDVKVFDLKTGWNLIEIKINYLTSIPHERIFKDSILLNNNSKFLNKEFTYVLNEYSQKLELQFKSISELSGPITPDVPEAPKQIVTKADNNSYGNLYQAKGNNPHFFNNYSQETKTCNTVLQNSDINYALILLKKDNDEQTNLKYMNQIIDFNCYSTNQLKELLEVFPMEIDRLSFAKQAYTHVIDKENMSRLSAAFTNPTIKTNYLNFLKEEDTKIKQKQLQCKEPITQKRFEELIFKISKENSEQNKLKVSKNELTDICLSCNQVKKLLELFTHDREKLDLIIFAYYILTDKENSKSLVTAFQFEETKSDFLNYLTKQ